MSISQLTSYSNAPKALNAESIKSKQALIQSSGAKHEKHQTVIQKSLSEALGPEKFEQLENLRAKKQSLMSVMGGLQNAFAQYSDNKGENLQTDIDSIVGMGISAVVTMRQLSDLQSEMSSLLEGVDSSQVPSVAEGKHGERFDSQSLAGDLQFAEQMNTFMGDLVGEYKDIKTTAKQDGDQSALNSRSMQIADRNANKVLNETKEFQKSFQMAAPKAQTISLLV